MANRLHPTSAALQKGAHLAVGCICLLVLYLPAEDFLLKWAPVSDRVYSYLRFISEIAIYGLLGAVLFYRLSQQKLPRHTLIDWPLLGFVAVALFSIAVNQADWLPGLITLRTLLRYVALYYILVNLPLTDHQVGLLVRLVVFVGIGEGLLGLGQYATGGPQAFWYPRATNLSVGGVEKQFTILTDGVEVGAVIGTFGHTVSMALYLVVCGVILLSLLYGPQQITRRERLKAYGALAVVVAAVLLTYSRASFFALLVAFGWVTVAGQHNRPAYKPLLACASVALVLMGILVGGEQTGFVQVKEKGVTPLTNLRMSFDSEYLQQSTTDTRLWLLKDVGGAIARSASLIGFSPDEQTARRKIVTASGGKLRRLLSYRPFEDVFWIAMFGYYGMAGLGFFCWMLYGLYRCGRKLIRPEAQPLHILLGTAISALVVVTIPLTFLVRTFEFRTFGFYFWLVAGLAVNLYMREQLSE